MDEVTHIINGMDIEGVLNGGDLPVLVDGRFAGEIHAEKVSLEKMDYLLANCLPHMLKLAGILMENWFATH